MTNLGQESVVSSFVSARRNPGMHHEFFCRCFYTSSGPSVPAVGIYENLPAPVTETACLETSTTFTSLFLKAHYWNNKRCHQKTRTWRWVKPKTIRTIQKETYFLPYFVLKGMDLLGSSYLHSQLVFRQCHSAVPRTAKKLTADTVSHLEPLKLYLVALCLCLFWGILLGFGGLRECSGFGVFFEGWWGDCRTQSENQWAKLQRYAPPAEKTGSEEDTQRKINCPSSFLEFLKDGLRIHSVSLLHCYRNHHQSTYAGGTCEMSVLCTDTAHKARD